MKCLLSFLQIFLFLPDQISSFRRTRVAAICGRESTPPQLRIVGGAEVQPYTWPWMVSLDTGDSSADPSSLRHNGHTCGGVLINKDWVLTAAHCLDDAKNSFPKTAPTYWRVTAGMHNRVINGTETPRWQRRGVSRFFHHPGFRDMKFYAFHDIALLQLDQPMVISHSVRPICLPNRRITPPGWNRCYTAGWGTQGESSQQYSLMLRQVAIPLVNERACWYRFRYAYNRDQHLCGGDWFNGRKDSCKGDSGGPLACQLDDGSWYVAGIVSWGVGCGRRQTPGVYTNVRNYEKWIHYILILFSPESFRDTQITRLKRDVNDASPILGRVLHQK